jgi:hypothetical protein
VLKTIYNLQTIIGLKMQSTLLLNEEGCQEPINSLARSYHAMSPQRQLRALLTSVYPGNDFSNLSKRDLHEVINHTLLKGYAGEEIIKYLLIKDFFNKKVTAAFELRVNNSRIDFLTINGFTKSYEIKSNLDNLRKLVKQMSDYMKVFEYNYIVIDEKHLASALSIVPNSYGIWVYKNKKKEIVRNAELNTHLDPSLQVNLFTKKEIGNFFKGYQECRERIPLDFTPTFINRTFKSMLKERYAEKWSFVKAHREAILPIDFHFFYHNNIPPNLIYKTN